MDEIEQVTPQVTPNISYEDRSFNPIHLDYTSMIGQMVVTPMQYHYWRIGFGFDKYELARALRLCQYFDSRDGNLVFSKEEILRKFTDKLTQHGACWWTNVLLRLETYEKFALEDSSKMELAIVAINELFPEIKL